VPGDLFTMSNSSRFQRTTRIRASPGIRTPPRRSKVPGTLASVIEIGAFAILLYDGGLALDFCERLANALDCQLDPVRRPDVDQQDMVRAGLKLHKSPNSGPKDSSRRDVHPSRRCCPPFV
jgi:hypothetical protein